MQRKIIKLGVNFILILGLSFLIIFQVNAFSGGVRSPGGGGGVGGGVVNPGGGGGGGVVNPGGGDGGGGVVNPGEGDEGGGVVNPGGGGGCPSPCPNPCPDSVEIKNIPLPVDVENEVNVTNNSQNPLHTSLESAKPGTSFTKSELYLNKYQSDIWILSLAVGSIALAQFLIALIFLVRIVILWFLLILSPFLLILSILFFSKNLFKTWGWVYLRWILIGPLLAMGIGITVNLWQMTGIPISSLITPTTLITENLTNLNISAPYHLNAIDFSQPEKIFLVNQISSNTDFMQLLIAIIMLYIIIFLPFWLTKKSTFGFIGKTISTSPKTQAETNKTFGPENQGDLSNGETKKQLRNFIDSNKVTSMIDKISSKLKTSPNLLQNFKKKPGEKGLQEMNISSKSPLNSKDFEVVIGKLDTPTLIKIAHLTPLTNPKRNQSLSELSNPSSVHNSIKQANIKRLREELEDRSKKGDQDAQNILGEIKHPDLELNSGSIRKQIPFGINTAEVDFLRKQVENVKTHHVDLSEKEAEEKLETLHKTKTTEQKNQQTENISKTTTLNEVEVETENEKIENITTPDSDIKGISESVFPAGPES